jgi:starch phosphorylase
VARLATEGYNPWNFYDDNPELRQALDMINNGYFSPDDHERFKPVFNALTYDGDRYLLLADYASYIDAQQQVEALYRDRDAWVRKAVLNVAHMGMFSSDRTIREYAQQIWNARSVLAKRKVARG